MLTWLTELIVLIATNLWLKVFFPDIFELSINPKYVNHPKSEFCDYFRPFSRTSFIILEKLTDDDVSVIFFDCNLLIFFAISLFNMIVILSAIILWHLYSFLNTWNLINLCDCQTKLNIAIFGNTFWSSIPIRLERVCWLFWNSMECCEIISHSWIDKKYLRLSRSYLKTLILIEMYCNNLQILIQWEIKFSIWWHKMN